MEKKHITWDEVFLSCKSIAEQSLIHDVDCIVAVSRGGLIPARIVSELTGVSHIFSIGLSSYIKDIKTDNINLYQNPIEDLIKGQFKIALIIDEICDTGDTFKYLSKFLIDNKSVSAIFSSLYLRENSNFYPSIYHKKISSKDWLVFPWEQE